MQRALKILVAMGGALLNTQMTTSKGKNAYEGTEINRNQGAT